MNEAAKPKTSPAPALMRAREMEASAYGVAAGEWSLNTLAGRLVELTAGPACGTMTAAAGLIAEAQRRGEPAAWLDCRGSSFYPPDLADWGIDLEALPVVRLPDASQVPRAADALLRSGGFALLILDLGRGYELPLAAQSRLAGLAMKHHTALVCLTRQGRGASPLGPLVSLRAEVERRRGGFDRFECDIRIIKDKRLGPAWRHLEVCRGPDGLC